MKSTYSDLLIHPSIHPNLACCFRFDRLSNSTLRSQSSKKPGLCRNFSSSKSNLYGFWSISWMSEPDGCKSAPDVDFYHRLFKIVIDLDYECGGWLLLVKHPEISSILFKTPNSTTSSIWKIWMCDVRENVMTLTYSCVKTAITASPMWCEKLSIKNTASHLANSSNSRSVLK
jgi:hypothetical protein